MEWFGPHPFGLACEEVPRVDTPTGVCAWCDEGFTPEDSGYTIPYMGVETSPVTTLAYHAPCWQRQLIGSAGHLLQQCSCFGGTLEDPPGLSKREAAVAAVGVWRLLHEVGKSDPELLRAAARSWRTPEKED